MIEVQGADQLGRLSKALKEAGNKDLQRELSKAINRAMSPVKDDLKQSARTSLPQRGGLADAIAGSKFATRRKASKKAAGIRLVATNVYSLYHLDKGEVRHRRKGGGFSIQRIEPGWWTKPTEAAAPGVRRALVKAMDDVARKIEKAP